MFSSIVGSSFGVYLNRRGGYNNSFYGTGNNPPPPQTSFDSTVYVCRRCNLTTTDINTTCLNCGGFSFNEV